MEYVSTRGEYVLQEDSTKEYKRTTACAAVHVCVPLGVYSGLYYLKHQGEQTCLSHLYLWDLHFRCVLSSWCSDERLMALVVLFLTELLSAQVAINPASSSQSNFQHLLRSGSCMADLAGVLLWNWEWCICSAPPFFWQFSTESPS